MKQQNGLFIDKLVPLMNFSQKSQKSKILSSLNSLPKIPPRLSRLRTKDALKPVQIRGNYLNTNKMEDIHFRAQSCRDSSQECQDGCVTFRGQAKNSQQTAPLVLVSLPQQSKQTFSFEPFKVNALQVWLQTKALLKGIFLAQVLTYSQSKALLLKLSLLQDQSIVYQQVFDNPQAHQNGYLPLAKPVEIGKIVTLVMINLGERLFMTSSPILPGEGVFKESKLDELGNQAIVGVSLQLI